jgi:hypothetical protein
MKLTTIIATLFFGTAVMAAPGAVSTPHHNAVQLMLFLGHPLPLLTHPS